MAGKLGPGAWRIPVQSAPVTSGELYHSSLKNMQIVMWDYFYVRFSSLILLEPVQLATCQQTRAAKYNNTSDTIVTLLVAPFMI